MNLIFFNADKFTVVSYNILGDRNAFKHRDMYRNVPLVYLKWEHRKRAICQELIEWDSDIICLQVCYLFELFLFLSC